MRAAATTAAHSWPTVVFEKHSRASPLDRNLRGPESEHFCEPHKLSHELQKSPLISERLEKHSVIPGKILKTL